MYGRRERDPLWLIFPQGRSIGQEVKASGIERPAGTLVAEEWERQEDFENGSDTGSFLVVRWPGHSYWTGIGIPRNYAPAETAVYRVCRGNVTPARAQVVECLTWRARSQKDSGR